MRILKPNFVLGITVVLFCVLALISISEGPKGNDQHWYLAATESIIQNHEAQSNNIFPRVALQGEVKTNPFIHNIPVIYLASLLSFIVGSFLGWFLFNIVMAGLIYYMIYKVLDDHFQNGITAVLTAALIIFPLNIMFATQALSEAFLAFLITLSVYLFYKRDSFKNLHVINICISILFALLVVSRANFILLVLLIPFLLKKTGCFWKDLIYILLYFISFAFVYLFLSSILQGVSIEQLKNVFFSYTPESASFVGFSGKDHETWSNLNTKEFLTKFWEILLLKLGKGIKSQFLSFNPASIYSFGIFNGLFIISSIGIIIKRKANKHLIKYFIVSLILFTIQFSTAVVFDNTIRYLYAFFPVIFMNTLVILKDDITLLLSKQKRIFYFSYSLIYLTFFLTSIIIANQYLKEAKDQKILRENISKAVSDIIPENETIWTENQDAIISYTLFPRDFLNAGPEFSDGELIKMIKNTKAQWFFSYGDDGLIKRLNKFDYRFIYVTEFYYKYKSQKEKVIRVYKILKTS